MTIALRCCGGFAVWQGNKLQQYDATAYEYFPGVSYGAIWRLRWTAVKRHELGGDRISPIVRDVDAARSFCRSALGPSFEGGEGDYVFTELLGGVKHSGLWQTAGTAATWLAPWHVSRTLLATLASVVVGVVIAVLITLGARCWLFGFLPHVALGRDAC